MNDPHSKLLATSNTYHIYNHANGPENLFVEKKNYPYFLQQYHKYITPIANTHAYCLMPNHFHILVTIKNEEELLFLFSKDRQGFKNLDGLATSENKNSNFEKLISQQFSNFFNSYSKAINKAYNRRGSLFLKNFRRKEVTSSQQLITTLLYIHLNPIKHGFTNHINDWEFTSYPKYMAVDLDLVVETTDILARFDSIEEFKRIHESKRLEILKLSELE